MNKVAHYLQQHLVGEVLTSSDVLDYYAHDESVLSIRPMLVVHPRNENDLRKAARFTWQLAERGRVIPLTMRGKGSDQTGAAIGHGIVLSTPAHMNKIIELDPKSGVVTVQAGLSLAKLQQTLHTHGRFLPSLTSATEYTTVGGAVANNDAGPSAYKFGPLREHTIGMRVVLANGELIRTTRLSKRELNKKLGLASFEGQIYRELDKLIEESAETIEELRKLGDRSNIGYAIGDVKLKDGSFDLTPLLVGSQGTLALMSEITLDTQVHNPEQDMIIGLVTDKSNLSEATAKINDIKDGPATFDFIDETVLAHVKRINPSVFKGLIDGALPKQIICLTSDMAAGKFSKRTKKNLRKTLEQSGIEVVEPTQEEMEQWQVVMESVSFAVSHAEGSVRSVSLVNDAVVPAEKLQEFLEKAKTIMKSYTSHPVAFWGQAGSGIVHASIMFDVSQIGDRQKMFKLLDEYYDAAVELGGSLAGESSEGRIKGALTAKVVSPAGIELMQRIKKIFDPFNILNPEVKVQVPKDTLKLVVKERYVVNRHLHHLPRG